MSSINLLQSLARVASTINRQVHHDIAGLDFESSKTPIERLAEKLEPAARAEIIRALSKESLYEVRQTHPASEAFNLGALGQSVQLENLDGLTNHLEQGREYLLSRVTRALALAVELGKTKAVDKLVSFSMKNSLDIPQHGLDTMLDQIISKLSLKHTHSQRTNSATAKDADKALEIYETLLTFKKSLNTVHTRDSEKFTQDTTRKINDHIALLIERGMTNVLALHVNLISKLDTSYYDSRLDEIGIAKIEHLFDETNSKDNLNIVDLLKSLRTHLEEDLDTDAESTLVMKTKSNTQAINRQIAEKITTNPKGALNMLGLTLNMPESKYDIKTDPHALAFINNKLPEIISNKKYSLAERSQIIRGFRAILNTYANTLEDHKK